MSEMPTTNVPQWTVGDRLRKALDHAGMSHQDMADYLDLSRNTIGNYTNGRTHVPGPVLKLWAMRTGVPLEWLRNGEDPSGPIGPEGSRNGGPTGQRRSTLPKS